MDFQNMSVNLIYLFGVLAVSIITIQEINHQKRIEKLKQEFNERMQEGSIEKNYELKEQIQELLEQNREQLVTNENLLEENVIAMENAEEKYRKLLNSAIEFEQKWEHDMQKFQEYKHMYSEFVAKSRLVELEKETFRIENEKLQIEITEIKERIESLKKVMQEQTNTINNLQEQLLNQENLNKDIVRQSKETLNEVFSNYKALRNEYKFEKEQKEFFKENLLKETAEHQNTKIALEHSQAALDTTKALLDTTNAEIQALKTMLKITENTLNTTQNTLDATQHTLYITQHKLQTSLTELDVTNKQFKLIRLKFENQSMSIHEFLGKMHTIYDDPLMTSPVNAGQTFHTIQLLLENLH